MESKQEIRAQLLRDLAEHYQVKSDNAPSYTPPKGGTNSKAVYAAVAQELRFMAENQ